ncbi:hypothetical protein halTADL_0411 [Halohasta litchfieldiae]|jgi:hypothetical protein|uniref:PIN domain-containing protein n=1 Tax=Halohasta litchfieldiae TaxID=1073996 RepID=A0A1H6W5Q6_9EURY|nr:hypothetical protein halTADL_0411 [Halohasta litchfieldiae]SEJ08160.1 hypothetical protein SAMN05444271_1203 [Halohasta litchfieldiae]
MPRSEQLYTANIVDTVIFRSLGKSPSPQLRSLKQAVAEADTELWVSPSIYRELTNYGEDPPRNPYLDTGIKEGWIRVATPLPNNRNSAFDSVTDPVEQAQHLADEYLNQQSKYPNTNNWRDASVVALAVRLFEQNTRIRVITHTADKTLAQACARIPPEFGYYDIESRYYNPPQKAKKQFPTVESLSWSSQ